MRVIRRTEMRKFNFWCAAIAQIFLLIFSLVKISRKLHEKHSLWKEKQKSVSLNGTNQVNGDWNEYVFGDNAWLRSESVKTRDCIECQQSTLQVPKLVTRWRTHPRPAWFSSKTAFTSRTIRCSTSWSTSPESTASGLPQTTRLSTSFSKSLGWIYLETYPE